MANFPKKLTPKEQEEIETMAGLGMRFEDITQMKHMSTDTLKKYAGEYLQRGKAKAKATVMQTAYKMATSGKYPAMTMFWLKTQSGWRENMPSENTHEASPIPLDLEEGLDEFIQKLIDDLKTGEVDPKIARAISPLITALHKANQQKELAQRLHILESIVSGQPHSLTPVMENGSLSGEEIEIEFTNEDTP